MKLSQTDILWLIAMLMILVLNVAAWTNLARVNLTLKYQKELEKRISRLEEAWNIDTSEGET